MTTAGLHSREGWKEALGRLKAYFGILVWSSNIWHIHHYSKSLLALVVPFNWIFKMYEWIWLRIFKTCSKSVWSKISISVWTKNIYPVFILCVFLGLIYSFVCCTLIYISIAKGAIWIFHKSINPTVLCLGSEWCEKWVWEGVHVCVEKGVRPRWRCKPLIRPFTALMTVSCLVKRCCQHLIRAGRSDA